MGNRGPVPTRDRIALTRPSGEIPEPPGWLPEIALGEWRRVCNALWNQGLLHTQDVTALSGYCCAYARWVLAEAALADGELTFLTPNGCQTQRPEIGIANKAAAEVRAWCKEFGMTPNARGRMNVAEPPEPDEMDKFTR